MRTKTTLVLIVFAIGIAVVGASAAAAARYPWQPVVISECKDTDSCPADGDCTSEVHGCHGRNQCADCLCTSTDCGCKCESPSNAWSLRAPDESVSVVFDKADDIVTMEFCAMSFDGFLRFLKESVHPGWEIATTVDPVPKAQVTWSSHWNDRFPVTANRMLSEVAFQFDVCVQINDVGETIAFFNCP